VSSTLDPTGQQQQQPPKTVTRSVGGGGIAEPPPNAHLPPLIKATGITAPAAPGVIEECGVEPHVLTDLALKLCNTVPRLTSEWAAQQLRLPLGIVDKIFWQLRDDLLLEILGQDSGNFRYAITQRGREYARRLLEVSGYVGPAPVSLEAYAAMLEWQMSKQARPTYESVRHALASIVLPEEAVQVASLAASSGRSLFLFGPPGNGKTSLGRMLHGVLEGELWIPHCISVESNIIRIFDPQCHQLLQPSMVGDARVDQRWLRVRRPLVIAGGEMTIDELDLAYSPSLRFYEAPPHVKANGGLFLLDDFGRQRINSVDLLNRWIIPLEHHVDFLTLATGQKIRIPFRLMLVVATNLQVDAISDPAFLRRIGYRVHVDKPDEQRYAEIFRRYVESAGMQMDPGLVTAVLQRYRDEKRELRASEPRDLIERCRDICNLKRVAPRVDREVLDLAWRGYFGAGVV
jgi:predicted ATPase with chaperone activity